MHCLDSEDAVDIMYYAIGSDLASQPQKSSVYLASRHGDTSNCACGKSDQCRVNVLYTHPYIPSKFHGKQYKCILFLELVIYVFREKVESLVRPGEIKNFVCGCYTTSICYIYMVSKTLLLTN